MNTPETGSPTPMASVLVPEPPTDRGVFQTWLLVFAAWVIVSAATLGALFFSEIMELPPCVLCWYQRIFVFVLALLLPMGLFPFDPKVVRYALPLALIGTSIAVYHQLLVVGVIPEGASSCTRGVPCREVEIEGLGLIAIPRLAVATFASIVILLILPRSRTAK